MEERRKDDSEIKDKLSAITEILRNQFGFVDHIGDQSIEGNVNRRFREQSEQLSDIRNKVTVQNGKVATVEAKILKLPCEVQNENLRWVYRWLQAISGLILVILTATVTIYFRK